VLYLSKGDWMMNDLQKEWLEATDEILNQYKEWVKNNEKFSFDDALYSADQINGSLNNEKFSSMWTDESQEKWQEIKNLFSMLVEPGYFVSANSSSSIN
jgi:hypothetical protein